MLKNTHCWNTFTHYWNILAHSTETLAHMTEKRTTETLSYSLFNALRCTPETLTHYWKASTHTSETQRKSFHTHCWNALSPSPKTGSHTVLKHPHRNYLIALKGATETLTHYWNAFMHITEMLSHPMLKHHTRDRNAFIHAGEKTRLKCSHTHYWIHQIGLHGCRHKRSLFYRWCTGRPARTSILCHS